MAWGPPGVKVRGGGKGSWTLRQIGMLPVVTLLFINKVKCHINNAYLFTTMQLLSYIKCK